MTDVLTKTDMYRRWNRGEFGNRLPWWPSVEAFEAAGSPADPVTLRYLEPDAPFLRYGVRRADVRRVLEELVAAGADPRKVVVGQCSSVDDYLTFQAEVSREPGGYHVRYTTIKKRMRDALREREEYATGLQAKLLLDHYLEPAPREWLDELFERYPGHVVEFSCWEKAEGDLGWNTIFWEVRKY
jgi:hypothetical protein